MLELTEEELKNLKATAEVKRPFEWEEDIYRSGSIQMGICRPCNGGDWGMKIRVGSFGVRGDKIHDQIELHIIIVACRHLEYYLMPPGQ